MGAKNLIRIADALGCRLDLTAKPGNSQQTIAAPLISNASVTDNIKKN
jgi:hypothetical protein